MWPIFPLVIEGLLLPALVCAVAVSVTGSCYGGLSTLLSVGAGFATVCLFALKTRFTAVLDRNAGRATRADHDRRALLVEEQAKKPGPLRMFKATASNTFRPNQIKERESKEARLDLSTFCHVIELNAEEEWCDIEGAATFETFVAETAKEGFMPLVVPELKTITVGGTIVGIGIESSSFKHGFVHEGLLEADVLVASGEIVTITATNEYKDLFEALPNSLGSFGYIVRLRMRIQKTQPFVQLTKVWHESPEALVDALEVACKPSCGNDFVDAVAISEQGGMCITGKFVSKIPGGGSASKYLYANKFYDTTVVEGLDHMEVTDYIWRWDADWFWCTQIFPLMSSTLVRFLCGAAYLRSDMYKLFNDNVIKVIGPLGLDKNQELCIQDIEVPLEKSAEWIRIHMDVCQSHRLGKIKLTRPGNEQGVPIWLCPVKGTAKPLMPMNPGKLYINFGFWDALEGAETAGGNETAHINRELEKRCLKHGCKKTLYSSVYLDSEAFGREYNGGHYTVIKNKYDPTGRLRGIYARLTRS